MVEKTDIRMPAPVPQLPVASVDAAAEYYVGKLGFDFDWGGDSGAGLGQVSRGDCRIFLFRSEAPTPVTIWLNLESRAEIDALHADFQARGARLNGPPEAKPWNLYEFTATDIDGNVLRVFYDFAWETEGRRC